jgi:O-antigen/teichoic acid export membrane protein
MDQPEVKEEVGGGIFFQYVNSFASVLVGFIFYIYIIHYYSSELVGTVALLIAITSLLNIVFSFGLGPGIQHFVSYHLGKGELDSVRGIVGRFSAIGLGLSFLSLMFLYFSAPVFASLFFHSPIYVFLIRFLGIDLFFMVANTFLSSILIGLQIFRSQALWSVVGVAIAYLLPVFLLHYFDMTIFIVVGWATGYGLSTVAYSIIIVKRTLRLSTVGAKVSVRRALRYSYPIFLASLIGYGSSYVDRFIVSYLLNLPLLGIYNFALLISSGISFLILPFSTILLPKLSEMYGAEMIEDVKVYISKGAELISVVYVPVSMLVAGLSPDILLFLSNKEYLPASIPVTIILISSSVFVIQNILAVSLQSIRKTGIFLVTSSLALLSNLIISVLLIPRFQMIGAAIGYSSVSCVSFLVMYFYSKKFDILRFESVKIAKIYLSAFTMFLITALLVKAFPYSPLKLLLFILVGFSVYSLMIKMLRTFSRQDADFVMLLIPHWLQRIKSVISLFFL